MATYSSGWSGYDGTSPPVRFSIDFNGSISGTTFSGTVTANAQMQYSGSYWGETWNWVLKKSGTQIASGNWGSGHSGTTVYSNTQNVTVSDLPVSGGNTAFTIELTAASPPGRSATLNVNFGVLRRNPTINSASVTNSSSAGSVYCTASVTAGSSSSLTYTWTINGNSYTGNNKTITGLAHNRTYNWGLTITASDGGTASTSGSVTTDHNAPSLSNFSYSDIRYGDYYTGTLSYDVGYDNVGYSSHSCVYGTTTSYGNSATSAATGSRASWTFNNLFPNTIYYYKVSETDNGNTNKTTTTQRSFTTSGLNPVLTVNDYPTEDGIEIDWSVVYDTNASFSSVKIEYGTTTAYGNTVYPSGSTYTITGLEGSTLYYYKIIVTDDWGHEGVYTSSFTTSSWAPRDIELSIKNLSSNYAILKCTYDVPSGDPLTSAIAYFKNAYTNTYTSYAFSSLNNLQMSFNLNPDWDYNAYVVLTNGKGTSYSYVVNFSTNVEPPVLSIAAEALSARRIQIIANNNESISATRYKFTCDGGLTWTNYQSSPSYIFTGLNEGTSYTIGVEMNRVHNSTYSGDMSVVQYTTCSTPLEQAKLSIKDNGAWKTGITWIKINGEWVKGKKTYIKENGEWIACSTR